MTSTDQSAVGGRVPDSKLPSRMMVVGQVAAAAKVMGRESVARREKYIVLIWLVMTKGKVNGNVVGQGESRRFKEC